MGAESHYQRALIHQCPAFSERNAQVVIGNNGISFLTFVVYALFEQLLLWRLAFDFAEVAQPNSHQAKALLRPEFHSLPQE